MAKVAIVTDEGGDWEGIYIDGRLMSEGHSLTVYEVLGLLGISCDFYSVEIDQDDGRLPPALVTALRSEVK